jgi:hypothetical protein
VAKDSLIHRTTCDTYRIPIWSPEDPFGPEKQKETLAAHHAAKEPDSPPSKTETIFSAADGLEPTNTIKGKEVIQEIANKLWTALIFYDIAEPKEEEAHQPK